MEIFDFICLGICFLHFIISIFQALFSGKRIERICLKCLSPVLQGEEHKCSDVLTSEQLDLLSKFVSSLRGSSDGSN